MWSVTRPVRNTVSLFSDTFYVKGRVICFHDILIQLGMQHQYNVGESHSYRMSVFAPRLAHSDSDLSTSQWRSAFIILCGVKPDRAELMSDKVLAVQRLSSAAL